jgi:chromosome segregation ATPase
MRLRIEGINKRIQGVLMGPVLRGLTRLQQVENRLRTAKAKLARCRRRVQMQENQLRALQNELEAKRDEIRLTRMHSDRLELDLRVAKSTSPRCAPH